MSRASDTALQLWYSLALALSDSNAEIEDSNYLLMATLHSRCLAIGAPDAEVKLQLLSEILQEHDVEWDSHRAHQEMVAGKFFSSLSSLCPYRAAVCSLLKPLQCQQ